MTRCFPLMNHHQIFHKNPKIDHNEFPVTNSPRTKWHIFKSGLPGNEIWQGMGSVGSRRK